jgi:glycosyltransferase involved in cell wall biosynthesis
MRRAPAANKNQTEEICGFFASASRFRRVYGMPAVLPPDQTPSLCAGGLPDCTLVIPTYNAAAFIDQTVARLREFLHANPRFRVLFVCDGCTDGTADRLQSAIGRDEPFMGVEDYPDNRGKGFALKRGLTLARTPYLFFLDADLAYGPEESLKLLALLEAGASLAVVNRADARSQFIMSPCDFPTIYRRHLMSRAFNWWLRQVLSIRILDTQAGLKGLTGAAWDAVAGAMRSDGFFFDVELLARVEAAGMPVAQTPVVVRYQDPTTVRMLVHGWSMLVDSLRLRGELRRSRRKARASARRLEGQQRGTLPAPREARV